MTGGLVQDAQNWLKQTKGKVKCVVLVCITKNKFNYNAYGEEDDEEMDSISDAESTDSTDSSVTHYEALFERFQSSPSLVSSYAGTLTAFIEVWRYDSNAKKMVLAQPRVELLPNISEARITFARTDLGFEMREEGAGLNEFEMDLQDLREDLSGEARQLLAYDRYVGRAQRRRAVKT
ncbi:hypothetical protein BGX38DRAFT_757264 [Terfezia claveryi]|nr:hypothetical protein BGX38DRAFT_757264 [Terfezia claveryi]